MMKIGSVGGMICTRVHFSSIQSSMGDRPEGAQ